MDKFALEGKVKDLESKIKEQTKKIADLTEASNSSKQVNLESF
jgi:cell division protein FtsL